MRKKVAWGLLSNHGRVLLCMSRDPDIRTRDLASMLQLTERYVQRIVAELLADGAVVASKQGRRNRYQVRGDLPLRHAADIPLSRILTADH